MVLHVPFSLDTFFRNAHFSLNYAHVILPIFFKHNQNASEVVPLLSIANLELFVFLSLSFLVFIAYCFHPISI